MLKYDSIFFILSIFCLILNLAAASRIDEIQDNTKHLFEKLHAPPDPKNPSYLFGMVSVDRSGLGAPYLQKTLRMLFDAELTMRRKVLVFLADSSAAKRDFIREQLNASFSAQIKSGDLMLTHVEQPEEWYPRSLLGPTAARCELRRNWGDTLLRVVWRSKLVYDFAFLAMRAAEAARHHGLDYYFQLEDDTHFTSVQAFATFHERFARFAESDPNFKRVMGAVCVKNGHDVSHLDFKPDHWTEHFPSMFGLVLHPDRLSHMSAWMRERYDWSPVDWLFGKFQLEVVGRDCCFAYRDNIIHHDGEISTKSNFHNMDQPHPDCRIVPTSAEGEFICWHQCDAFKRR